MKRQQWGLYAIALAMLLVGLIALGVPASTLLVGALVLACPLMMLFMHGGGHDHGASDRPAERPATPPQGRDHHDHQTISRR